MPGDDPGGSTNPAPSWAGDAAEAGPAQPPAVPASQMPLFHADGPAPPRVRRARLRARIKALLTRRLARKAVPPAVDEPSRPASSWPDSFFDGHGGS